MATTIVLASGKGGVGKTSLASNLAYTLARLGRLVLAVDLDSNPGLSMELGLKGAPGFDHGAGMVNALISGAAPTVLRRAEELHVIPGGVKLKALPGLEDVWRASGAGADSALRDVLAPLQRQYDYVIIDAPPGGQGNAAQLALGAADYCLIPTKADSASMQGVADVGMLVGHAQRHGNPDLAVLGVVLFDLDPKATIENRDARARAEKMMGAVAPVFDTEIRESKKASRRARDHGMPVLQYDEEIVAGAKPWYEDPAAAGKVARNAGALAKAYVALTGELVKRIDTIEADRRLAVMTR
jgi:cellulose biosynthesis protein BcsQ